MKRAFVLLAVLFFVVNSVGQSCSSNSGNGTLAIACEDGNYRSLTTCSEGSCTYNSWYGGYGSVHVPGEEGIRLETTDCSDQACKDRLSRREERWRRLQMPLKLLSAKHHGGFSGYLWLESCERSAKCSQEIADDPIFEQIKEINNLVYLTQYLNECDAYRLSVKRFYWQLDENENTHCSATAQK